MRRWISATLMALALSACTDTAGGGSNDGTQHHDAAASPPDGAVADTAPEDATPDDSADASDQGDAPAVVLLGWTFHHEDWSWEDDAIYDRYLDLHTEQQALFDEAGARMTSETADLYAREVHRRGDDAFFQGLVAAGHALGIHADLGGRPQPNYGQAEFEQDLGRYKRALEETGVEVVHVSGICSHLDWVTAARRTGFKAVTGNVAYCLSSLPRPLRPDPYKDCEGAGACHQVWPSDLEDRIHPWRMKDGATWINDDPAGEVILIPTSGTLTCFAESRANPDASHTQCEFDAQDIDAFLEDLDAAVAAAQPGRTNTYYLVWSMGKRPDAALMRQFFDAVQPYIDAGTVQWATIPEMIAAYEAE